MVKRILYFIVASCLLLACNRKDKMVDTIQQEDHFIYPIDNTMTKYYVADDGILYYTQEVEVEDIKEGQEDDQSSQQTALTRENIYSMNYEGEILHEISLDHSWINQFLVYKNKIYYYTIHSEFYDQDSETELEYSASRIDFYEYSIDDKMTNLLFTMEDMSSIKNIVMVSNRLYIIGHDNSQLGKSYMVVDPSDSYQYQGEVLIAYDVTNRNVTSLAVDFPINISPTSSDTLMIYAYESSVGYYLQEYDPTKDTFLNKYYKRLGNHDSFAVINKAKDIVYTSSGSGTLNIAMTSLSEEGSVIDLVPYASARGFVVTKNHIFYQNGLRNNRIERIAYDTYIRDKKTIKMISSQTEYYSPFGCGYSIQRDYPDWEQFALKVLSQDSDFDIYLMSSRDSMSKDIKNKETYYPLNDVPGVEEYINKCFPYLKEAATTSDGDIWMLPIAVDIPVLFYHEENCKKSGLDLTQRMNLDEFVDDYKKIEQNQQIETGYYYSPYIFVENEFLQYFSNLEGINQTTFESLAYQLKADFNYINNPINMERLISTNQMIQFGDLSKFLFIAEYYADSQIRLARNKTLRVSNIPSNKLNDKNAATTLFISVNPNSKNLQSSIDYISTLCSYLQPLNNSFVWQDRSVYSDGQIYDDLYAVYQNGRVAFNIPSELYMDDFERYLSDEISKEDFVKESLRRIDIYLKE